MKGKNRPDLVEFNKTKKYSQLGENNPTYKHGKQSGYKDSQRLSKNIPCESCSTLKDIHVHHQNLDHADNGYSNLKWLC